MFKTFLLKILRTLKQREQENAQSESSEARKISFLYVNWARNTKTFLMTLPPSPDVIQRILFTGFSNRDGLTPESEIEYYELQVLFALLFKRKKIQKIMRILSEQSEEPTVTSNDDISPRKESKLSSFQLRLCWPIFIHSNKSLFSETKNYLISFSFFVDDIIKS